MTPIRSERALEEAIARLEQEKQLAEEQLKNGVRDLAESLKPGNLIKSTVRDLADSEDLKENLLIAAAGLAAGYAAKRIAEQNEESAFNHLMSAATQYGITEFVAKHPNEVKAMGRFVIQLFSSNGDE